MSYSGADIVAADSRLRRLPYIVNRKTALSIEGLVFSADAIVTSYRTLRGHAARVGIDFKGLLTVDARMAMVMAAWSIVDHLHAARQLFLSVAGPPPFGPITSSFLSHAEIARVMRNNMDHLKSNLANLAKAKHPTPVFGALNYCYISPADVERSASDPIITGGYVVTIVPGSLGHGETSGILNPIGRSITPPVGAFQLEAFGSLLEIDDAVSAFAEVMRSAEEDLTRQIDSHVDNIVAERGVAREAALNHPAGWVTFALAFSLGDRAE